MTAAEIAAEQAEDEGIWFHSLYASEAYLQAALRRLTAAVESEAGEIERQLAFLSEHYAAVEKRYGEILDERERLKTDLGERRMCVNCGRTRPASEPKDELPECTDPETGLAACTWDSTPHEAWEHWRQAAHDRHQEIERLEADARRYRYIRFFGFSCDKYTWSSPEVMDAAIDAEIEATAAALEAKQ